MSQNDKAAAAARHAYFGGGRHGAVDFSTVKPESRLVWYRVAAAVLAASDEAPAATEAPSKGAYVDAFLCRAWGETDLTSAEIVEGWAGVRAFMVREWLGEEDATNGDGGNTLDQLKADFDEHEEDERGGPYTLKFEIGGVSVERVTGWTRAAPTTAAAVGASLTGVAKDGTVHLSECRALGGWPGCNCVDLIRTAPDLRAVGASVQPVPESLSDEQIIAEAKKQGMWMVEGTNPDYTPFITNTGWWLIATVRALATTSSAPAATPKGNAS